ncbi:MAG: DUF3857 domain-containing protein [Caulobacterales bacterium]
MNWPKRRLTAAGIAAAIVLHAGIAAAADAPQVGPAPAWVSAAPAVSAETDAAKALPVAILLSDTQLDIAANGWTEFHRIRARVQSPDGLQALGALPFQWSPWCDTLTFHSASIQRGDQSIDILPKDGAFTVLRRETGLERATLTGELTALLQPDGLQVGDVLEFSVSIRHADPLLKRRDASMFANWDQVPIAHMRLQAHWPSSLPVRWQESAGLPALKRSDANGVTQAALELDDVRPVVLPAHAPARFLHGRQIEFTTFADWGDVAAMVAPLFAKAAELEPNSAVAEQARLIAQASADPKARASAALRLVQEQVRYLAHAEAGGGYAPQSADETWRLRSGDCKAKTVLLVALLRELGIHAEPVLASLGGGDGLDTHLPSIALFDHALVRAKVDGRDYWLDGARVGDRSLDDLAVPAYGWVLPVEAAAAGLVRLEPEPAERPQMLQVIRYDASGGVSAPEPTHLETTFRGDAATVLHAQLASVQSDRVDASLKAYWAQIHTAFTPTHVEASWDPATGEEKLVADGTSKLDWSGSGLELQHVELGGAPDIKRDPDAIDQDAPYTVAFPIYVETDETVVLPPGDVLPPGAAKAADVDSVIAGVAYHRTATVNGQSLRVVATQRALKPEISATEARASVDLLTKLGDQGVYAPAGPQAKAADAAAAIDSHPSTVDGHLDRGNALLNAGRLPEALTEFDAAIALDAESQTAWADRAIAHAWLADPTATADADRADALGAPEIIAARARGLLAANTDDVDGARTAFRRALTLAPNDAFTLRHLLPLDIAAHDPEAGARDLEALKQVAPDIGASYHLWEAAIEQAAGRKDAAEQELAQAPADTPEALLQRAQAYLQLGDDERSRADADSAIRMKPSVLAWMIRANADGGYVSSEADADVDAAAKLASEDPRVIHWRMTAAVSRWDFAAALALVEKLIAAHESRVGNLLVVRGQVEARLGQMEKAQADFATVRTATGADAPGIGVLCATEVSVRSPPEAALADCERDLQRAPKSASLLLDRIVLLHRLGREEEAGRALDALEAQSRSAAELNNVCYSLAGEGIWLQRALADCDASLKLGPGDSATLDSRGFVLLRLGRAADALEAYNAALAVQPKMYNSLYGRGLVEARMGREDDAVRDIHAAMTDRPYLRQEFEAMGLNK